MRKLRGPHDKDLVFLLAEDSEDDRILIQRGLRSQAEARRIITISNGEDVLAYLQGEKSFADRDRFPPPDLLLIDHRMPRLSGLGVICWLRSHPEYDQLPVVLLSGQFSPQQTEAARKLHVSCCPKLLDPAEMQQALQSSLMEALALRKWHSEESQNGSHLVSQTRSRNQTPAITPIITEPIGTRR